MLNILDYIDSKDIREYNRNTKFTPFEKAYLIYNCKRPLEEKISALKELLNTYTEEDFGEINKENRFIFDCGNNMKRSRKSAVENTVNWYQSLLNKRYTSKDVVFSIRTTFIDDCSSNIENYYTSYECNFYMDIIMIKLDCEYSQNDSENDWVTYSINDEFKISNIYADKDNNYNDDMHDLCAIVPVPFKKGDILRFKAAGKINYGVLACDLSNEKYTIEEIAVDIFDKDENGNWKYGYDHVSIFDIEICGKEGLPNGYEILKDYSDLQLGKISSREFFFTFSFM